MQSSLGSRKPAITFSYGRLIIVDRIRNRLGGRVPDLTDYIGNHVSIGQT